MGREILAISGSKDRSSERSATCLDTSAQTRGSAIDNVHNSLDLDATWFAVPGL